MCKVQVKAKNERQNDDYATANTNPNSSSHHDEAHHIRRRLSQTISSRYCLLIAIAFASLSAHACDDTVELQVTCDSGKTPWVVPSSITQTDYANETKPQMVTVGSCINGRVADIARVESKDIDANGIVRCSQSDVVCYHLKRQSGDQIEAKNCDNYDDPNCTYYCDNGVLKFRNDKSHDITASDTCFSSNFESHNYGCNGNELTQIHCPNGCADDHQGCKPNPDLTDKCTADDTPICEGKMIKICKDQKWESTGTQSTCQKADDSYIMYECQDSAIPTQTTCPLGCDKNGDKCKHYQEESCSNGQTKCAGDLKGRVDCNGIIIDACQYCYTESIENNFTSIEKLGCKGCVPNEYNFGDSSESLFNTMNSICYNGKESKFDNIENRNFLFIPEFNKDGLWGFALNVTPALSKDHPVVPANDQSEQTWRYYNCYNNAAMKFLEGLIESDDANDFLKRLNKSEDTTGGDVIGSKVPKTCCDDENSYYIIQTGYRYYSVEKCTNIALYDTSNGTSKPTNFSAYAYTPELNDSLIGVEDNLLAKDYACLEVRDNPADTNDVRQMMFIKQKTNGEQQSKDGEPKHGIYKAFECPEKYECDLKNPYNGLCILKEENIAETIKKCGNFKCDTNNTISCNIDSNNGMIVAACPKGTTLHIVGDNDVKSKCDNQSNLKLDQIRCVPVSKSTPEQ